ncbi:M48 family metalloprotease [Rhodoferax saidenbachensis]|uniref:Peptidase n=1 Tax=Rhodoferax saidenbachensis TaxID=1484693 RepID=A0A1P8KE15_9BURK|nr:M48 family metalloprotease [Rhodoferax saidenbachensis]APW44263.1 peptidase [Rhodoferax saidenbachensis]
MKFKLLSLAFTALLLTGCGSMVVNPVTGESERSVMSEEAEIAEGAKAHQEVLKEYGVYKNTAVQNYVNTLGQKLATHSHRSNLQWHFTVLDSPEINAFALPGGYVYVTRGIMAYMESEADLAGVIGHEIGHVTARHGAQRATSQQNAGIGVFAASVLGAVAEAYGVSGAGQLAGQVSQTVAAGYVASYGRDQELQADKLGAEYLARSNYDPHNMVDVITVLKNQERFAADEAKAAGRPVPTGGDWLASHPSNDQRLQNITELAAQYQGKYDDEGRARYLKVIAGLEFGESPDQGLTRGRNFYHAGLGFAMTAPSGWQINNGTDQLALTNAARDAALIVRLVPPKVGKNHTDILRNVFKPTQGRTETTQLNGLQATRFTGTRQTAQGQQVTVQATVVSGPGDSVYLLQSNAKDAAALQRASAGLREAEGSFRALTAQDRNAAKPWVLKTVAYPRGGFAELAKTSPLEDALQQLRLINGFYGGGEPKQGQLVKVVDSL